jgi:hypothetical protein
MSALGFGPFIGDFESEVVTFRPYVKWISEVSEVPVGEQFLFTHFNRTFMYDWIPKENIFTVYQQLARDELEQEGYIHKNFKLKDFNILIKLFKDNIVKAKGCTKKDIELHHLSYVKNTPVYSIFQKSFTPINTGDINIQEDHAGRVVFIPHDSFNPYIQERLHDYLVDTHDAITIGNVKTGLKWGNVILNYVDYFENGYKYIIKYIAEAKIVICPVSYWTFLANLQGVPVFSFGKNPGLYREDGIYHLDNKKSMTIAADEDTSVSSIIKMIEHFMRKL